jgi:type I restriction enzyme R subunit
MPRPGEHKAIQARTLAYAQEIGWTYVPRSEAEKGRGFDHSKATPAEQAPDGSPYFDDLLSAQVRNLKPEIRRRPRRAIDLSREAAGCRFYNSERLSSLQHLEKDALFALVEIGERV